MVNLRRAKSGEKLVEARSDTDVQIVRYAGKQGRETNRTISQLVPSNVSQVLRMIGEFGNMLFSTYSQTETLVTSSGHFR